MANEINNGGPAFPGQPAFSAADDLATSENIGAPGMTLRDYFAGQAMSGMLAWAGDEASGSWNTNATSDDIAQMAYKHADAMLAARSKGEA